MGRLPPRGNFKRPTSQYSGVDLSRPLNFDDRVDLPPVPLAKEPRVQSSGAARRLQSYPIDDMSDVEAGMDWDEPGRGVRLPPAVTQHRTDEDRWAEARPLLVRQACMYAQDQEAATLKLLAQRAAALPKVTATCDSCIVEEAAVLLITLEAACEAPVQYRRCSRCVVANLWRWKCTLQHAITHRRCSGRDSSTPCRSSSRK